MFIQKEKQSPNNLTLTPAVQSTCVFDHILLLKLSLKTGEKRLHRTD